MLIQCIVLTTTLLIAPAEGGPTGESLRKNHPCEEANAMLRAEVLRLVRQLDAPQLARRDAAEAELMQRGPAILDVLPTNTERMSAEVQQRLDRVRQKLQRQAADAAARSSTITLHENAMPLSKVIGALAKQSGNAIADNRQARGQPVSDPAIQVNFDKTPFWPALDRVLDQAGLTLYLFAEQPGLSVVAASAQANGQRAARACYAGPLRIEPVEVLARRDLRLKAAGLLTLGVEIAWEPRLRIIGLTQRMADVRALDDHGRTLAAIDSQAVLELPISGNGSAVKLDLPLRLPPRGVQRISSLRGTLAAMIPGKTETFRFDKLSAAKNVEKRIAGVTVTLEEVAKSNNAWEVRMKARFDDAGDAMASHRNWVFTNPAFLEGPDGKPIAYDTFETTAQEKNEVGIAYLFTLDKPLDQWTFVYKTPGTIVTSEFPYEFKDIALP
ncbi:MAG: hypothetical protein ABFC63_09920 [Thermoguttaceae bacterium]